MRQKLFHATPWLALVLALGAFLVPSLAEAQMVSGTYTGNGGASQSISGLGFQPDIVIVKGNTTQTAVIRTSTMAGDNTKPLVGLTGLTAGMVQSLDAGGFTVGASLAVNAGATAYYWMAFKATAGETAVGSYAGTGATQTIPVGFQPDHVIIMSAGANAAVQSSTQLCVTPPCGLTAGEAIQFDATAAITGGVAFTAFVATGFQVGTDARTNAAATTYHYVAWKAVPGKMAVGVYTAPIAGAVTGLGFRPEYVIIKRRAANIGVHRPASLSGDTSLTFTAAVNTAAGRIVSLDADGFTVGTSAAVNSTLNYIWAAFRRQDITTLGNGTDPASTTIAPGGAATMADAFTLATNAGTDSVTAVTVTLAAGTSGGLSLVEITDDAGGTVYGSVANPATDTPAITLTTPITVTTTATQYKIRITPKTHANMPPPAGSSYAVTARISAWTGTNAQAGSDSAGTTVTVDNLSPANVTGASATAGDGQVSVSWTNPGDVDFSNVVVLRKTATITDVPVEGSSPAVDTTIGTSIVRYISNGSSFIDTGLTNGTPYFYRVFAKDSRGNYAAAGVEVSATPAAAGAGIAPRAAAQAGTTTLSLTINKPTGTVQNDVMIASIGFRLNSPGQYSTDVGITPPAGWALVGPNGRLDNPGPTGSGLAVYLLVAGASEPASYTWTFSCTGTCATLGFAAAAGGIVSFSGVDTTTPINVENGAYTSGYALLTPDVTTTVANAMLVTSYGVANADTWANPPPSGMTQAFQVTSANEAVQVNWAVQPAAGATGQKQATDSGPDAADAGNAHILALRPPTVCTAPNNAGYVAANARSGQGTVYWSSANPVLILRKTTTWAGEKPSDAQEYNVNDAIAPAATIVFKGTGSETSFNQTSLTNGTTYRYKVFTKSGSGASACYSSGTEVTALHPSAAGSPQTWSYGLVGGSMLKPGIAGNTALYASGNGGRVVSLSTGTGTQNWTPAPTNAAVQGWLSWVPLSSYRYRQRVTITAGSAAVPNGYSVSVTFNHASLVTAGKSKANGDDIRVFYKNGSSWVELDRALDRLSSWNNAATKIWFKAQAAIGASSSDSNYYLHYGNPSAASPPANKSNVYDFFDDFSGTLAAWTQQGGGTWTISGGILLGRGQIDGDSLYVTGKNYTNIVIDVDFRAPTSVADDTVAPAFRLNTATGARYDFSHKDGAGSSTRVRYWSDWITHPGPDTADATPIVVGTWYHATVTVSGSTFTAVREGGPTVVHTDPTLPSGTVGLGAEYVDADFDNIQVRLYVNPEPTTAQAAEEEDAGSASSWLDGTVLGGDQSARVFRVNTATGVKSWEVAMTGADAVQAAVSVQVRAWSNAAFKAAYTDDVIFATTLNTTNTNCGTPSTNNKIYALRASDGTVLWTFNATCTSSMDTVSGQPWVDYARNRLYVTSRAGSSGTQPSLWVIRIVAEGPNPAGSLVASFALGHINGSPTRSYGGNTLYAGTEAGRLYALNLAQNPPVLKWGGSTYANVLGEIKGFVWEDWTISERLYFATNAASQNVWCLQDPGVGGTFSDPATPCSSWTRQTVPGASTPLLLDKLYVGGGASDGKVHEINLTNGGQDSQCTVGDGTKAVGDASSETAGEVFVGTTEKIYRLSVPFPVACP